MDTIKIKKGLGRGLSSLIGEAKTETNINKVPIIIITNPKHAATISKTSSISPEMKDSMTNINKLVVVEAS